MHKLELELELELFSALSMVLVHLPNSCACFSATAEQVEKLAARTGLPCAFASTREEFIARLPEAEIVLVWTFEQEWFALAPKLRIVWTPAAGRDYFHVTPPANVELRYGSFHGAIMGETISAAVLGCAHGLLPYAPAMSTTRGGTPDSVWPRTPFDTHARRVYGQTLLIVGMGRIGSTAARMLQPFGIHILGVTAHEHPRPDWFREGDELHTLADLDALLPRADHIVCVAPSGKETDNLFDERRLSLCKRGAYFYNFGRGNIVDPRELRHALNSGHLNGAVLDVFTEEPLPAESELRYTRNCILLPHASAFAPDYLDLFFEEVAETLDARR